MNMSCIGSRWGSAARRARRRPLTGTVGLVALAGAVFGCASGASPSPSDNGLLDENSGGYGGVNAAGMGTGPVTVPAGCGNGLIDGTEACEGPNLNGATCASATLNAKPNGSVHCSQACQLDVSGCSASAGGGTGPSTGGFGGTGPGGGNNVGRDHPWGRRSAACRKWRNRNRKRRNRERRDGSGGRRRAQAADRHRGLPDVHERRHGSDRSRQRQPAAGRDLHRPGRQEQTRARRPHHSLRPRDAVVPG